MEAERPELVSLLPQAGVNRVTRLGIELSDDLASDGRRQVVSHVAGLAHRFSGARQTLTAWLGDALVHCAEKSRGLITDCATAAGLDPGTVRNAKLVCSRIPLSRRHDALSWTHHCEVALVFSDPGVIEKWLTLSEVECLSSRGLRHRIRAAAQAGPRSHVTPAPAFLLLRDLRACDRLLRRNRAVYRRCSPEQAASALSENPALVEFVLWLRCRAGCESSAN